MKVQHNIPYDNIFDCFRGRHNIQVTINTLVGTCKQPIFDDFVTAITLAILHTTVNELEKVGLRMRGFVSDMEPHNMLLLKIKKNQCLNAPVMCHIIKKYLDSGFELSRGKIVNRNTA